MYYINRKFARVNKKNIQDEQIYSVKHEKNLRNTQTWFRYLNLLTNEWISKNGVQAVKTIYFDEVLHHCIGGLLGAEELWTWRYNWCWSAFVWTMKKCIVDTLIINYQPLIFLAYYLSRKILFSVSLCFLSFYSHVQ